MVKSISFLFTFFKKKYKHFFFLYDGRQYKNLKKNYKYNLKNLVITIKH